MPRAVFGEEHMAACNLEAIVRGKLEMLRQRHVWVFSNMWFNPANYRYPLYTWSNPAD